MNSRTVSVLVAIVVFAVIASLVGCSTGGSSSTSTTGKVSVSLSDPPTCSSPNGAFANVFVTILDVQIHQSSSAGPNDPGWVDLTPNLKSAPQQVDLLGLANNQCFLATLGSNTDIQAGTYQQIRVILGTTPPVSGTKNPCGGNVANCVVLSSAPQSPVALDLSSETQTGIKIPSGQLTGGKFTIAAGEVKDLNIDFDACASIIAENNGHYRLKPVLHAGEMQLTSAPVSGTLVDSISLNPVVNASGIVALEQRDANGIDRVIIQTKVDPATGNFVLCPVPDGTYDVVAVMVGPTGTAYAATITSGVQRSMALGKIPMVAQGGGGNTTDASLQGTVTTTTGSAATAADVTLFAMQQVTLNSTAVKVIIPLAQQSSATASVTTASGSCGAATLDCANYTLAVPAMWPNIGTAQQSSSYTQDTTTLPIKYLVGGTAYVPQSGSTLDCNPSEVIITTASGGGDLIVTPGNPATPTTMAFGTCQAGF